MNRQHQRILLARLPSDRFHQKSVHVPTVCALERHALDRRERQLFHERCIEMGQRSFASSVQVGDEQVVEVRGSLMAYARRFVRSLMVKRWNVRSPDVTDANRLVATSTR